MDKGYLNDLKNGHVYWIDTSEVNPVIGMQWGRGEGGEGVLPVRIINITQLIDVF